MANGEVRRAVALVDAFGRIAKPKVDTFGGMLEVFRTAVDALDRVTDLDPADLEAREQLRATLSRLVVQTIGHSMQKSAVALVRLQRDAVMSGTPDWAEFFSRQAMLMDKAVIAWECNGTPPV